MAIISSLGVGSGLDLASLVRTLVASERAPAEGRLNRDASRLQAQISALGQVKSGLATLEDALGRLSGLVDARAVQVSNELALSASATTAADLGSYPIEIFALARAQSLASAGFTDPDASLGSGQLTLAVGGDDPVTIDIEAGANSLRDVRDAINNSGAGIRATLLRDGGEWRLLLSSEQSGLERTVSVTASGGLDGRLESAAMTETVAPADALFSIAGFNLSSPSNVIDDVLPGVTLTLRSITESPMEFSVIRDEEATREALDEFVEAYNAVIDLANELSRSNPETGERAALTGDAMLRSIRGALPAALGAATGATWNAVELGLRSDRNSRISLDADAFAARLLEDPAGALASLRGFSDALGDSLGRFSGSGGVLNSRTETMQSSLRSIDLRREQLDRRIELYESRLRRQFGALDQMISQMQSTSNFLASQLATLAQPPR